MKLDRVFSSASLALLMLTATYSQASECTIISSNVGVSIEECGWNNGYTFGASYAIHNDSAQSITAFAVSTTATSSAEPWKELMGWQAQYVSEQTWNSASSLRGVGLFSTLFGPNEHAAFLFWNGTQGEDGLPGTVTDTEALAAHQFHVGYFGFNGGFPASEFLAFTGTTDGGVGGLSDLTPLGGSFGSPVPEPTSMALMLAGLGVVGSAARRRRA